MSRFREQVFVWTGGVLFVAALVVVAWWYAVEAGRVAVGSGREATAVLADAALFSVFAMHHSLFARAKVKTWLAVHVPQKLVRSVYVWVASLLLIAVCALWIPVGGVVYRAPGLVAWALAAVQIGGIAFIWRAVATIDPLDLAGIRAAREETRLQTTGPYALVRHPLYFGWILIVFGAATMTGDRLLFAAISSAYLVAAIPWEEGTLSEAFGGDYARYQQRVRWRVIPGIY